MRPQRRRIRIAITLAASVLALAATAQAASAITIEPLNKHFESATTEGFEVSTPNTFWRCEHATIAGTTNATKTNFVNVTPTITGCSSTGHTMTYKNACKVEGTVPWTLTLTAGTGPFTGTTKLNCAATLTIDAGECVVQLPEQTIEKALNWKTVKATEPFESTITLWPEKIKYTVSGLGGGLICKEYGFKGKEDLKIGPMHFNNIKGIKAV